MRFKSQWIAIPHLVDVDTVFVELDGSLRAATMREMWRVHGMGGLAQRRCLQLRRKWVCKCVTLRCEKD